MTEQELNKQVVRDYFQKCWNENNLDAGYDLIKKDYEWHLEGGEAWGTALEGWRVGVGAYLKAFPDCHWVEKQMLAEGDLVCVRHVWTATHSAEWMGVPASGKKVEVANFDLYRLEDGKLAEHWDLVDWLAVFKQIGGNDVKTVGSMFLGSVKD